jgi:hypothetical protein
MSKWVWEEHKIHFLDCHKLEAVEVAIHITPRSPLCDRGRWECHVLDAGHPTNPNPVDFADMFPRLFFSLERAKAEMEDWMDARNYIPVKS